MENNRKPKPPVQHWAQIGEFTFVAGIWFLYGIYRILGRAPFRLCLYPVLFYYWSTRSVARRSSLQYLQRMQKAYGQLTKGRQPHAMHSLRHFFSYAETLLDKTLVASGRYQAEVKLQGYDAMLEAMASGQGGVIVTAHIGCLELCENLAQKNTALRLTILVHTKHAERFNRLMKRIKPNRSIELMQIGEVTVATALRISEKIQRGEFVAIAGDRVPIGLGRSSIVHFLGHPAHLPVGPYVIAALMQCPLYLMLCTRAENGHTLAFEKLADKIELPRTRRDEILSKYACLYAARLESSLKKTPYEWFNFFQFWDQVAIPDSFVKNKKILGTPHE